MTPDSGATPTPENPTAGATPDTPEVPPTPPAGATPDGENSPPDGEETPKTAEELQSEIESLKSQLLTVNNESAQRRRKLSAFEAEKQKQTDAQLSDAEREKKRADDAEAKLTSHESKLREYSVLDATRAAAQKQNLQLNEAALLDAYAAGAFKSIEFDDDGRPQGVDAHLKELVKTRSYLLQNRSAAPEINAGKGGKNDELVSDDEYAATARRFGLKVPRRK